MHLNAIAKQLDTKIINHQSVSGGDINRAFLIETEDQKLFVKSNSRSEGAEMLKTERQAIDYLNKLNPQFAPKPIAFIEEEGTYYLVMEHIETGRNRMSAKAQNDLAEVVYELHQHKSEHFGWSTDNYIGALPQYNNTAKEELNWPEFYWKYRIKPQLEMAIKGNYLENSILNIESSLIETVDSFYEDAQEPTLTHGDLWSGNYLIDKNGKARLIDPAICYSHPDMDLGMSQQFGGFNQSFYDRYYELTGPPATPLQEKVGMFQLYFVLVHVNLFGSGYLSQTNSILSTYNLI